ncbi:MarR family transcriptional regulator [Acidaminobacter sp. JC074]|uniref:MarR family winged helix-turn-helix transcriptional regulator n=1 Tax=Acidaminobacter sp. JC074 TaxID=2530199 RepID=UPI001F0E0505|nr:MarR family transcriptional regulator [Acidaminobacter sp. JC074]MCH4890089.1 MarR family transcriptional regulator [Acidaminobacter sp. JC074]
MIIRLMGAILKEFEDEAKRVLQSMDLDVLSKYDYSYFRYLMVLKKHPHINQNDLAKFVNVNKGSASKAVKFLLSHDLIQRLQDEKDSRVKKLCLTDLGDDLCDKFKNVLNQVESQLMDGLSNCDISNLNDMLSKAYKNLSNEKNEILLSILD